MSATADALDDLLERPNRSAVRARPVRSRSTLGSSFALSIGVHAIGLTLGSWFLHQHVIKSVVPMSVTIVLEPPRVLETPPLPEPPAVAVPKLRPEPIVRRPDPVSRAALKPPASNPPASNPQIPAAAPERPAEAAPPAPISTPVPTPAPPVVAAPATVATLVAPAAPESKVESKPAPVREPAPSTPPSAAAYLNNPEPAYPTRARREGLEGTVALNILVTKEGRPERVEIKQSSGAAILDNAALEAVRQWRFVPAKRAGEQVEAWVIVPLVFRLDGR